MTETWAGEIADNLVAAKRHYYAIDWDLHPQYDAYWICRFASRRERNNWVDANNNRWVAYSNGRYRKALRYAKKHNAFYDTDKMTPAFLFD